MFCISLKTPTQNGRLCMSFVRLSYLFKHMTPLGKRNAQLLDWCYLWEAIMISLYNNCYVNAMWKNFNLIIKISIKRRIGRDISWMSLDAPDGVKGVYKTVIMRYMWKVTIKQCHMTFEKPLAISKTNAKIYLIFQSVLIILHSTA